MYFTFSFMLKKILSIFGLAIVPLFSCHAQTAKDIFGNKDYTVTWYGIDYSHSKVIGKVDAFGVKTPITAEELRDRYYSEWNYLILDEPDKFNIAEMISRKSVVKDITIVKRLNAAASLDSIEAKITPYYTPQEIQKFVSAYPIENKAGIGLVFITESMNKTTTEAYYHVVFFKMDTKEILLQERLKGTAGGSGTRNYWAGSYYNVMEYIKDAGYQKWKKTYGPANSPNTPNPNAPKW